MDEIERISITKYNAICNLGDNIDKIYNEAISANINNFEITDSIIKGKQVRLGKVNTSLAEIDNPIYNTRCNRLLLTCLNNIDISELKNTYGAENIATVVATTNTGVEEFEKTKLSNHFELGNPAEFIKKHYGLNNISTTVSTACSSGIKAFSIARNLLKSNIAKAVIVAGVDSLSKLPVFGFESLGVLTDTVCKPFCKDRSGINIGEGVAVFILEKNSKSNINILGIGETTDAYHSTCPDPTAKEAVNAIRSALKDGNIKPEDIDYINLHGTGTISNDLMESTAINKIFGEKTPCSSTKVFTGHCLGASSSVEVALCCKLLELNLPILYPNIYNDYDESLAKINLVKKGFSANIKKFLCTSFGFGGTNTAIVLGVENV